MPITVARTAAARSAIGATLVLGAWLFLAAMPVAADGGPHIAATNSGVSTLTADSCAGCHRAHTAKGEYLLNQATEEDLCLGCHGAASTGATTDVMTGVQYAITAGGLRDKVATTIGASRSGGFDQARIASNAPYRRAVSVTLFLPKVSVRATPQDVTSAHLNLPQNGLSAPTVAWGNGAFSISNSSAGPTVSLSCASCHNPHGNGQYRILNPVPNPSTTTAGTFAPVASPGVTVTDAALPGVGDTRNYSVIQVKGTPGTPSTYMLYASNVLAARGGTGGWPTGSYGATAGDYFRMRVPWNGSTSVDANDAPNGIPSDYLVTGAEAFTTQITAWCTACHTRYLSGSAKQNTGDIHFRFRHETEEDHGCTTCHVAHGSNAQMTGPFSGTMPYPDDSVPASFPIYDTSIPPVQIGVRYENSRLLKIDNRGTCQACHDPTHTITAGQNLPVGAPVPPVP